MSESLYEYRARFNHRSQQASVVLQGRREFVEQFIPQREFPSLFGGFILSLASDFVQELLGVWGVRTASRFRSLLRARGAVFSITRSETAPFDARIVSFTRYYDSPAGNT